MTSIRFICLAICLVVSMSGCSWLHNLQPHRLWRLNRQSAPSGNPYYSVSDPIPELDRRENAMLAGIEDADSQRLAVLESSAEIE